MTLPNRRVLIALSVFAVFGLLYYAVFGGGAQNAPAADDAAPPEARQPGSDTPASAPPETPEILVDPNFDPADKRRLIAVSDNVFVAVVEDVAGERPTTASSLSAAHPQTQYAVRVLDTLKTAGAQPLSTGARTTVNQLGGRHPDTGETHVVTASYGTQKWIDAPLQVGERYLFATWYDPAAGWHSLTLPRAGAEPLDAAGATDQETLDLFRAAAKADTTTSPELATDPPA